MSVLTYKRRVLASIGVMFAYKMSVLLSKMSVLAYKRSVLAYIDLMLAYFNLMLAYKMSVLASIDSRLRHSLKALRRVAAE